MFGLYVNCFILYSMETFEQKRDFNQEMEMARIPPMILELRHPVEKILEQISPLLESGEVELIIGDDASGRIPTAIFRKIFDLAYKERGFPTPETRFLSGSRYLKDEVKEEKKKKIAEYLEQVLIDIEKKFGRPLHKVLVVTDVIKTGHSLDPIIEVLNEMGIAGEVVSVSVLDGEPVVEEIKNRWKVPVHLGADYLPDIYGQQKLSGVVKQESRLFAETYKNAWGVGAEEGEKTQEQINKARDIADNLAVEVYTKWKTTHT